MFTPFKPRARYFRMNLFFDRLAPAPGPSHPSSGERRLCQLVPAATDGMGAEAGDTRRQADAAAPVL
jgi:hypothetical protein